jgi:hypothetical protein
MSSTLEQVKSLGLQDGESIRVNHSSCRAGVDYKQRLWVIRNNGKLGWKCHHCGEKGRASIQNNRTTVLKRLRPEDKQNADSVSLPSDFDTNFLHWPPEARAWILRYGIQKPESWGWSKSQGRVIIPVWEETLKGYQARRIFPEDPGPKYLTRGRNLLYSAVTRTGTQNASVRVEETGCQALELASRTLAVICEDALSAEKVGKVCNAYALLGTNKFDHEKCLTFGKEYAKVYIWFDDDKWEVQKWGKVLAQRLGLITETKIIRTGRDPKEHPLNEIKEILT